MPVVLTVLTGCLVGQLSGLLMHFYSLWFISEYSFRGSQTDEWLVSGGVRWCGGDRGHGTWNRPCWGSSPKKLAA